MIEGEYELVVNCDHKAHCGSNLTELFQGRNLTHCLRRAKKAGWNLYWYRKRAIMTDKRKAELLRILKERHGLFEDCKIEEKTISTCEGHIAGRFTHCYVFDHAVVTDVVHAWLMGLHNVHDIELDFQADVVHVTSEKGKGTYAFFPYPLSVAIWNVLEFVLKEMGDA